MYRGLLPIADPEKKYRYGERERLPPPPPPPCITVFRLAAPRPCVFCIFSPSFFCFALTRFLFFLFFFSPFFFDFHGFDSKRFEFRDICDPRRLLLTGELISRAGLKRF